ncbi:MAG TPA: thioredoxin family protein [Candidatus Methanofastidiosa archaeon]|nr:thioredoxin family protein [Candidatus Methanofastidiosa archaeon]HPR41083.1 thioredoxin family protein [Candidatus Methanofastidiosa archaeon]
MGILFFKSQNCPRCPQALKNVEAAIAELDMDMPLAIIDISTTEGRIEALNNMVSETPSMLLEEELYGPDVLMDVGKIKDLLSGE